MAKTSLEGQVVLITGASSGIGRSSAEAFARAGAVPVLAARTLGKLEEAVRDIRPISPEASLVQVDVSDPIQVERGVARVMERYGSIDVLFNNAGHATVGPVSGDAFAADARQMFEVDFMGTVSMTKAVLPSMKKRGKGHIINMSSVVGRKAFPGFGGYSAVMHAVSGFTDALRQELVDSGILVSSVHPALTQTALFTGVAREDMPPPFRRMTPIAPDEVAQAVVSGVRAARKRIVVPGQPHFLLLMDALSPTLGDRVVRLLENEAFSRLIGSYRGSVYVAQS